MKITAKQIEAARTGSGWTRKQLEEWGVPWPPPKGWRKELEKHGRYQGKAAEGRED